MRDFRAQTALSDTTNTLPPSGVFRKKEEEMKWLGSFDMNMEQKSLNKYIEKTAVIFEKSNKLSKAYILNSHTLKTG